MSENTNRRLLAFCLLPALAAFLVYLPALGNGFVNWDDPVYVYENLGIRSFDLEYIFTETVAANWHPLTVLSHTIDYALWGLNPRGHHLTSVIIHSINTALVFILAFMLVEASGLKDRRPCGRMALTVAFVSALLFGLHPLHVESVAWVSERKDVLSGLFYLLSLILYLGYAGGEQKRTVCYAASLFIFVLALMSKPMAVSLPLTLLILDFHPLDRLKAPTIKRALVEKIPFFAFAAMLSLTTLFTQKVAMSRFLLTERVNLAVRSYVFYIYKTLLPVDLLPVYPRPSEPTFLSVEFLGSLVILLAITVFCVLMARRKKLFLSVWLYFVLTLAPVIGIIQVGFQAAADRYMYLPSLGPFMLVGIGAGFFVQRSAAKTPLYVTAVLTIIVSVVLSLLTVSQTGIWKDSFTLWHYEISRTENRTDAYVPAGVVYYNLALAYDSVGDFRKAINYYDITVKKDPKHAKAYMNRGIAYGELGMLGAAIDDLNRAVELDPGNAKAFLNRGAALLTLKRYEAAKEDFSRAVVLDPENAIAYFNLGLAHYELGETKPAVMNMQRARTLGLKEAADFLAARGL
ncbi:MAG TPA: tetratricopeptide repeat protein [Thermodesulfobacteriota bacterium]|nr:tetratricopeptide repeat protein [Thermodesulfobacteriota bacterium]